LKVGHPATQLETLSMQAGPVALGNVTLFDTQMLVSSGTTRCICELRIVEGFYCAILVLGMAWNQIALWRLRLARVEIDPIYMMC